MPCPNDHRKRLITIGFRVTPEQSARINDLVAASGMTKQDYIVKRLQCEEIVVTPSSRVYKALRDRMGLVYRRALTHRRRRLPRRARHCACRAAIEGVRRLPDQRSEPCSRRRGDASRHGSQVTKGGCR
ncbi:plasmid mobilization protein [Bifidobacterium merycicum]|uniref:plasmid mobilization protein n=1 Tax=Bifidobacterium merycicum TaxID=78345 RepID=UPI0038993565